MSCGVGGRRQPRRRSCGAGSAAPQRGCGRQLPHNPAGHYGAWVQRTSWHQPLLSVGKSIEGTGPGRDVFDPNYWLRGAGEAVTNTERGNFTFGHGPRRCIGQSLATVELVVLLAVVARVVSRIDMTPEEAARPFGNPVFGHPLRPAPDARAARVKPLQLTKCGWLLANLRWCAYLSLVHAWHTSCGIYAPAPNFRSALRDAIAGVLGRCGARMR